MRACISLFADCNKNVPDNTTIDHVFLCVTGIFAYLNFLVPATRKEIIEILLNGLKRMEYRGYDSAGKVKTRGDNEHQMRVLHSELQSDCCLSESAKHNCSSGRGGGGFENKTV